MALLPESDVSDTQNRTWHHPNGEGPTPIRSATMLLIPHTQCFGVSASRLASMCLGTSDSQESVERDELSGHKRAVE
jgi:hypothetical protein